MTSYIAVLRAVNLPNRNRVGMADLKRTVEGLGFAPVQTLLASGNLVFGGPKLEPARVERTLESALEEQLGLRTAVIVRTAAEWSEVIRRNPFPTEARSDPGHLVVVFLKQAPAPSGWDRLRAAVRGPEVVRGGGREAYIHYAGGIGSSKLTAALIDRALATVGTGRNWNTVEKLDALGSA